MNKGLGLCIDCGTGSVRAQLFDWSSGEWVGNRQEVAWTTYEDCGGKGEIVMFGEASGRAVGKVLSRLISETPDSLMRVDLPLHGIAIGGHMHAPFVVEHDGRVVVPVQMWNSDKASRSAERLSRELGWKIDRRLTAAHISEFLSGAEPAFCVDRASQITTCSGYIGFLLSSRFGLGPCEGSGMGFLDPANGKLSGRVIDSVCDGRINSARMYEILPAILEPGALLGKIDVQTRLGKLFPPHWQNAVVAAPEGDQAMGRLALCRGPQDVSLVLGSSLVLITVGERWQSRVDETNTVDFFTDPSGLPMSMGLITNGMRIADRFVERFAETHFGGEIDRRAFEALAQSARSFLPLSDSVFGLEFPFRDPALGVAAPFSTLPAGLSEGETWAVLLLQIASSIGIRARQLLAGGRANRIVLGGAAARDDFFANLIATATGVEVLRPEGGAEAMLLGAQALVRTSYECQGGTKTFSEILPRFQPKQSGKVFCPDESLRGFVAMYMEKVQQELLRKAH